MEDLTGTSENQLDKQSGEKLSAYLEEEHWRRLPNEMQIKILKQENVDDGDKLNLLYANPNLLPVIISSYPHDKSNAVNGGEGTEAESSSIIIKYSSAEKMFCVKMPRPICSRKPHRIFGLKHDEVILVDLDSESKHTTILLKALGLTSTTTERLWFVMDEADFQLSLNFVEVLKPRYLDLGFGYNEECTTLNELVAAFPTLSELKKFTVFGPVRADGDSLFSHLSKLPRSLCFNNAFLHDGHVVKFLRALVSMKFEEGRAAAAALKQLVNWKFNVNYETEIEEGEAMNGCKLLSELIADIIPPNSKIRNLDWATGTVERHIFKLHLAVGDEQHVIYVKEKIDSGNRYRSIKLANQTENFYDVLNSLDNSISSDMNE